jgi:hypothetical protein
MEASNISLTNLNSIRLVVGRLNLPLMGKVTPPIICHTTWAETPPREVVGPKAKSQGELVYR